MVSQSNGSYLGQEATVNFFLYLAAPNSWPPKAVELTYSVLIIMIGFKKKEETKSFLVKKKNLFSYVSSRHSQKCVLKLRKELKFFLHFLNSYF